MEPRCFKCDSCHQLFLETADNISLCAACAKNKIEALQKDNERLNSDFDLELESRLCAETWTADLRKACEALRSRIMNSDKCNPEIELLQQENKRLRAKNSYLVEENTALKNRVAYTYTRSGKCGKSENENLETEVERLQQENECLSAENGPLHHQITTLLRNITDAKKEAERLQQENEKLHVRIDVYRKDMMALHVLTSEIIHKKHN